VEFYIVSGKGWENKSAKGPQNSSRKITLVVAAVPEKADVAIEAARVTITEKISLELSTIESIDWEIKHLTTQQVDEFFIADEF